MTEADLSLDLAATFGPILKKSFPDASPRWLYAVAGALAESVITRRSWFAQPVDETERLRAGIAHLRARADGFVASALKQKKRVGPLAAGFRHAADELERFAALQHKGEVSRG